MPGSSRTCSWSTRGPSRRSVSGATLAPCYNVVEVTGSHVAVWRRYPFHGAEKIIQFDLETLEYEKYTGRIEDEVTAQRVDGDAG